MKVQDTAGLGLALVRVVVGVVFVAHGAQKAAVFGLDGLTAFMAQVGIPLPLLSAVAVTLVELIGGAALVLGLFTRWAAAPLAFAMLVATLVVHLPGGFFLPEGVEFTLTLLAVSVGLVLTGPGALALDNVVFRSGGNREARRPADLRAA